MAASIKLWKEWYRIREKFFTHGKYAEALLLAADCAHPEAQWLVRVFSGENLPTHVSVMRVLRELGDDDARGLFYRYVCGNHRAFLLLLKSASLGFAWAQAYLSSVSPSFERASSLALQAIAQGEIEGFLSLAEAYQRKSAYESSKDDFEHAKQNYRISAWFGCTQSMYSLSCIYSHDTVEFWVWAGRRARSGLPMRFLQHLTSYNVLCSPNITFVVGRVADGYMDHKRETFVFRSGEYSPMGCWDVAIQAVDFYKEQNACYEKIVSAWLVAARRLRICKDLRKLIGRLIWTTRGETLSAKL